MVPPLTFTDECVFGYKENISLRRLEPRETLRSLRNLNVFSTRTLKTLTPFYVSLLCTTIKETRDKRNYQNGVTEGQPKTKL